MMRLEDYLQHNAAVYPDKVAVVMGEEQISYHQLWEAVWRRAAEIEAKGRLVPFRAVCAIGTLVEYFAIHVAGGIAMPLEKDLAEDSFLQYKQLAMNHGELSADIHRHPADVLFTTGTTGKSKGVVVSHETIIANAENLVEAQHYHHDMTFIVNGPLNHIGSLSKLYPIILVGGTLHLIDGMKNMDSFFHAIEAAGNHVATFLVPASIRMLLAFAGSQLAQCADRIEMIETGAAPISQADMQQLCHALPHTRLYNTYASTETGIIATYDYQHEECLAGCLGRSMKHSEMLITADGHVACKGDTLMMGYLGDAELTQQVLRDGILYTADLGRIDEKGRLRLEGRKGDVFNIGGYKVMPTEVEDAALSLPMVKDCVCVLVEHRVLGNVLKLLVVLNDGYELDKRSIAKSLQSKLENYKIPMLYEQVDAIKRTFNGKIDRKFYKS